MSRFNLFFTAGLICTAVLFLSNSGGRASATDTGNTGAPGDAMATCVTCHNNNAALAGTISVTLLDANSTAVTSYMPGEVYTVRVELNSTGTPTGYGFQMIPIKDSDGSDAKGFPAMGSGNYKIATITNGRTYAEHNDVSPSNTFDVKWTAPASGTGNVTFYAAGNMVNSNGQSSGDGADKTEFTVSESSSSSAFSPSVLEGELSVFPNPIQDIANIRFDATYAADYMITVRDLSGKSVYQASQNLQNGVNNIGIPSTDWSQGAYILEIRQAGKVKIEKMVKL